MSGKSLREALIATGASTLIGNPDPNQAFFVWIYAPGSDTKAAAASWHAVFEALEANKGACPSDFLNPWDFPVGAIAPPPGKTGIPARAGIH